MTMTLFQDLFLREKDLFQLDLPWPSWLLLSNQNQCWVCCVCIYGVREAEWWIGLFPSSVDRQQTNQDREKRTPGQGRKGRSRAGGREAGPQTSHLPPLLPRGLRGMGTALVSTQTPSLHAPASPSTGPGPALPGWDSSSPTRFPHSVTPLLLCFVCFLSFYQLCVPSPLQARTTTLINHTDSVTIVSVWLAGVFWRTHLCTFTPFHPLSLRSLHTYVLIWLHLSSALKVKLSERYKPSFKG